MKELKKQEKEWVLYDVGNSAFVLLCTTIIPIYFKPESVKLIFFITSLRKQTGVD